MCSKPCSGAAALARILEAYNIVTRIGRLEDISVIGATFGQVLISAGNHDEGLAVLRRSAEGYRKLGRPADATQVETIIRQIEQGGAAPEV